MTQPKQDQPAPERWLPVVGYEGLYEVSDLGRVRNRHGRILTPQRQATSSRRHDYLTVKLWRDPHQHRHTIHRLVGEAFLGPLPPGMQTRHGPGGHLDNRLANLSYGTPSQNQHDRVRDGTHYCGSTTPLARLTEAIVIECRRRHAAGELQDALAYEFGVSQQTLSKAIRGVTWRHVPQPVPSGRKPTPLPRKTAPNVVSVRRLVADLIQTGADPARIKAARAQLDEVTTEAQVRLGSDLAGKWVTT